MDVFRSHLCWYDHVEVRDGFWRKAPLKGLSCNQETVFSRRLAATSCLFLFLFLFLPFSCRQVVSAETPFQIQSSPPTVTCGSNSEAAAAGWAKASQQFMKVKRSSHPLLKQPNICQLFSFKTAKCTSGFHVFSVPAVCGGVLRRDSGQIQSPNYPDDYQSNKACVWKITVAEGFSVGLSFQSFEVKSTKSLLNDAANHQQTAAAYHDMHVSSVKTVSTFLYVLKALI